MYSQCYYSRKDGWLDIEAWRKNAMNFRTGESRALQRAAVVGATGSGKTCLAQTLSDKLAVPHVELDALFWEHGWQPARRDVFRARVEAAVAAPAWVTDGNYHSVRDMIWPRATALIWLDYPLPLVLWRLAWRTLRRLAQREVLWNGNHERLRNHLFSRDSLFLWALKSHPRQRREYPAEMARPAYRHLAVVHLRSPRETEQWLTGLD
jgi:adenylate kinase family enzyme